MKEHKNIIVQLSFRFALKIIEFSEQLETKRRYVVAKQLLRSGTSIGANINEAQSSESKRDFIHKMKIAAKEIHETEYWLLLCNESQNYPNCQQMIEDVKELNRIVSKIVYTSISSLKRK